MRVPGLPRSIASKQQQTMQVGLAGPRAATGWQRPAARRRPDTTVRGYSGAVLQPVGSAAQRLAAVFAWWCLPDGSLQGAVHLAWGCALLVDLCCSVGTAAVQQGLFAVSCPCRHSCIQPQLAVAVVPPPRACVMYVEASATRPRLWYTHLLQLHSPWWAFR